MGEVEVKGEHALDFVNNLITNDASVLEDSQILYTPMCYENGGVVDDILVYRFNKQHFILVVNASNVDKDFQWMNDNKRDYKVELTNISENTIELALQGPNAQKALQKLVDVNLEDIKFFYFNNSVKVNGVKCLISRTGYTGEDGFEIYTSNEYGEMLWNKILEAGKEYGIVPAGLGCRDTLRFEVSLPLYGNEISENISPLEAGLGFFVKLNKSNFIGKAALAEQKKQGLKRKLVGFEMVDRGIPRHGYEVSAQGGSIIGFVTTGYRSPSLGKNIGLAIIDSKYSSVGAEINIHIRNKHCKAEIISKKFYNKNYKK
jgi:aminomethyltransferase